MAVSLLYIERKDSSLDDIGPAAQYPGYIIILEKIEMNVGIIKFTIRIPANQSLKGKRKVVSSLCQKLRNKFAVSVAEVESNDDLKTAVIGISFVSNSTSIIHQVISQILLYLQEYVGDFVLINFEQEIIAGF